MVVRLEDSKKGSVRPKTVGDNTINELIEGGRARTQGNFVLEVAVIEMK